MSQTLIGTVKQQNGFLAKSLASVSASLVMALALAGCGSSTNSTAAAPTFTPAAGTFTAVQTVTISDATPGAVLHCTTDGSAPTTSSPICVQPTTIGKSSTLSAIAVVPGGSPSAAASAAYTINLPSADAPVIATAGTYAMATTATITDDTVGATIYYTTDGTTPTVASPVYDPTNMIPIPVTVPATVNVQAIAVAPGYADSSVTSAAFVLTPPTPTPAISPATGNLTGAQTVTLSDAVAGAAIFYTLDGSTPTASSIAYTAAFTVGQSETVNAIAIAPAYTQSAEATVAFTLTPPAPTFSVAPGTYTTAQSLVLSDVAPNPTIFYTITENGKTGASTQYTNTPITLNAAETIAAYATAPGFTNASGALNKSATASDSYTVTLPPAPTPTISPVGGAYNAAQSVTITDPQDPNAVIYYTTNGKAPTTASTLYTGPITVSTSETIMAADLNPGYGPGLVASAAYMITLPPAATPTIMTPGTYNAEPSVTITDTTPGAKIYYTLDGSTPTNASVLYTSPFTALITETVKAIAYATGYSTSNVASGLFTINQPNADPPGFSVPAGMYTTGQTLTLTDTTANAKIYYTVDGTTPTNASIPYTAPIVLAGTETIEAIAYAPLHNPSVVVSKAYMPPSAPSPTFDPTPTANETYSNTLTVSLADADTATNPSTAIYYTTDGTDPSVAAPGGPPTATTKQYFTPINVTTTTTIKALATINSLANSPIVSETYTLKAAVPTFTKGGTSFSGATDSINLADDTTGSTIYYTTDTSMPMLDSSGKPVGTTTKYTSAGITISATTTINAIAVAPNFQNSAVATETVTQQTGIGLIGKVMSGGTPIANATVQMYAAGTTGYGMAPTPVTGATFVTGNDGAFNLQYTCTAFTAPGDLMYVVATGGGINQTNANLALMTALGPCATLTKSSITVNEVTTIASVYALSGFASFDSTVGIDIGAPEASYVAATNTCSSVGNSTCGYPGLANAFATVNNLVDTSGGSALSITPAYQNGTTQYLNTSTVPLDRINTLADMLATCVDSASGCAALFGDVGGAAPKDTLQAALDIALNPGTNATKLYDLVPAATAANPPPYTPNLVADNAGTSTPAPEDWTLAITYTGAGLGAPAARFSNIVTSGLALDSAGDVWVTGATLSYASSHVGLIAGFNNQGAPLTEATTYDSSTQIVTYGGFQPGSHFNNGFSQFIIDPTMMPANNLWIVDSLNANLEKVTVTPMSGAPPKLAVATLAGGVTNLSPSTQITGLAFDSQTNLWVSSGGGSFVASLKTYTTGGSAQKTYSANSEGVVVAIAFDSAGSLWVSGNQNTFVLNPSNGTVSSTFMNTPGQALAAGNGTMYGCSSNNAIGYVVFDTAGVTPTEKVLGAPSAGCSPLVVDGAGNVWSIGELNSGNYLTEVNPNTGALVTPAAGYTGTSSSSGDSPTTYLASEIAVDGSGNLWALNSTNSIPTGGTGNVLTEFVGVAAPTITPLALATATGNQGTKP